MKRIKSISIYVIFCVAHTILGWFEKRKFMFDDCKRSKMANHYIHNFVFCVSEIGDLILLWFTLICTHTIWHSFEFHRSCATILSCYHHLSCFSVADFFCCCLYGDFSLSRVNFSVDWTDSEKKSTHIHTCIHKSECFCFNAHAWNMLSKKVVCLQIDFNLKNNA